MAAEPVLANSFIFPTIATASSICTSSEIIEILSDSTIRLTSTAIQELRETSSITIRNLIAMITLIAEEW